MGKKIFQDKWFQEWFMRKDELLKDRFIEIAWILRHLDLDSGNILDAGCGASFYPLLLSLQGFNVTAIDTHDFDYKFPNYEFIKGDISTVRLNNSYNRILLISVLQHVGLQQEPYGDYQDSFAVDNLNKYLKDDGYYLATVPFGVRRKLDTFRIYDLGRISMVFPHIEKMEFFMRVGNIWKKAEYEDICRVEYDSYPAQVICCVKARKIGR